MQKRRYFAQYPGPILRSVMMTILGLTIFLSSGVVPGQTLRQFDEVSRVVVRTLQDKNSVMVLATSNRSVIGKIVDFLQEIQLVDEKELAEKAKQISLECCYWLTMDGYHDKIYFLPDMVYIDGRFYTYGSQGIQPFHRLVASLAEKGLFRQG